MKGDPKVIEHLNKVLKNELIDTGVPEEKILVALNAIDPDTFKPDPQLRPQERAKLGAGNETVLVGYLGSYTFYHNTELLVRAASGRPGSECTVPDTITASLRQASVPYQCGSPVSGN